MLDAPINHWNLKLQSPMTLYKRDGKAVPFNQAKIYDGIYNAMVDCQELGTIVDRRLAQEITDQIVKEVSKNNAVKSEEVYETVVNVLAKHNMYDVLGAYVAYRDEREEKRDLNSRLMKAISKISKETTKDNANVGNSPSAKMLQVGSEASKWYNLAHMPKHVAKAHINGDIHIHDLDYYEKTINCVPDFESVLIREVLGQPKWVKMSYFDKFFQEISTVVGVDGNSYEMAEVEGVQVMGRNGWTRVVRTMRRPIGDEPLYAIKTRKGTLLHLTGNHKVPVLRRNSEILVLAKDINKGDILLRAPKDDSLEESSLNLVSTKVADIDQVEYTGLVYDIETADHWFAVNNVVVHNCMQIPLLKLLTNGFDAGRGYIRSPKRIGSAAALSAIILQANQNDMYGGQSFNRFETAMAPFVPKDYTTLVNDPNKDEAKLRRIKEIEDEVYQAMEGLVYNLNSLHSRAGAQVPFSNINFGTGTSPEERLVIRQLLLAFEAGLGRGETPLFPNLIYRVKKGINRNPGDPNYDLFQLACRVASKRMNPTFSNMDSSFNAKWGEDVSYMGCRSRVQANVNGLQQSEGRGNIGFVTINLPRIAIESRGDIKKFYRKLDRMLTICEEQLLHRYGVVSQLRAKDLPFTVGQQLYVESDTLKSEDSIHEVVKQGTFSIGYIGLAEVLMLLSGGHHGESEDSWQLGYEIIEYIAERVKEMTQRHKLNFTTLATPAEGLSGRFTAIDREKYGVIPGITDKGYYVNSYH